MKNLIKTLLVLVLTVFAIGLCSVKAEEVELTEEESKQEEVVEVKKDDDKPVVKSSTTEINTKEENNTVSEKEETVVEEVKEETPVVKEETTNNETTTDNKDENTNTNSTSSTTNTPNAKDGEEELDQDVEDLVHTTGHNHCVLFMNDVTGREIQRGCTPQGTSGSKTFPKSQYQLLDSFSLNGYTYIFKGWYDADGNLLTTDMGVKVKLSDPGDSCKVTYVYAKFDAVKEPIYMFNLFDYISDTTHSWNNTNGHWGSFEFTFKTPTEKNHYSFLYYKFGEDIYNPGDTYTHDITNQGAGSEVTEDFYAWWKADVTLKLYDGTSLLGSLSKFDSVSISDILSSNPTKSGYRFLGWVDADGNDVTETTFYAEDAGTKPTPKEVVLYAKWKKLVSISVTKTWDDNNNEPGERPGSVTVHVKNGEDVVESVDLSEENDWTYTFEVDETDENGTIQYTVIEDPITGYTTYITGSIEEGFIIKNVYHYENVTVTKIWDDFDGEDGLRPDSVTIYLYADGDEVGSVTLSDENGWTDSFGTLDAYNDGAKIDYTISEVKVEYYETSISGDASTGFTVTNKEILGQGGTPEDIDEDDSTGNNPNTGDTIIESIIMLMVSLSGLVSGIVYLNKSKLALSKN